jgi:hypothetical protein
VLVTADVAGTLFDRRRIELVEPGLPPMPHHHDAQSLPIADALALVERVRASADRHATQSLDTLAGAVPVPIRGVALRACPPLPSDPADRIRNYRARNVADWVMYREALAAAAAARGWRVNWYTAKTVLGSASAAMHVESLDPLFARVRRMAGPPWTADHRIAMAAAIAAHGAMI